METCSSREDLVVKVRKPYTITKQRERWTDEEHRRFLEAVKLYGRAWQKIEEHVGSKTAIQIRSHAQKFFTKLEKEALRKGLTLGQAQDIDIPPPRPKRKPSNPYPRKTCTIPILSSGESISPPYQKKYSAKNADPEKPAGNESLVNGKMISENGNSSAVLAQVPDASCPSISSVNEGLGHLSFPGETLSLPKGTHGESVGDKNNSEQTNHCTEVDDCTLEGRGIITKETDSSNRTVDKNRTQMSPCCHKSSAGNFKNNGKKHREAVNANPTNSSSAFQAAAHGNPNLFAVPSFAPFMPSIHNLHGFPSCTLYPNSQDVCRPFNNSPAFLNLITSTLQQNPAVFAAARLAASSWPGSNGDTFLPSELGTGGIPERHTNPSPGMTAVAAATVTAATAWWAMHGMLPFCPPFPADFSFTTPSMVTNAMNDSNQTTDAKEAKDVSLKALDAQLSNTQMHRHSAANLSPQQSSDSDESGKSEDSNAIIVKSSSTGKDVDSAPVTVCPEQSNKVKLKKKQDRSSCSSNTPSSCDDTDIILENLNNIEGKMEDMQAHLLKGESNPRRSRSSGSASESWKEVSEEGRIAFRALFSREVLPQSFSPPEEDCSSDYKGSDTPSIDLNSKKGWANDKLDYFQSHCNSPEGSASHSGKFPSLNQPGQGGLKANRTGFKPYKRCSLEAKETNAAAGEENGVKRIRLEDESSS